MGRARLICFHFHLVLASLLQLVTVAADGLQIFHRVRRDHKFAEKLTREANDNAAVD